MEYYRNLEEIQITEPTVFSIGKFDGIHRGHGALMKYLQEKKKEGFQTVVFTFDVSSKQKVLTTQTEKMQLFESYGIDYLIEGSLTPQFMQMEAETFVEQFVRRLCVKYVVVGRDFRFGFQRRGDYHLLQSLAEKYGYEVNVLSKIQADGTDISSTKIRNELSKGNIEQTNAWLGYAYFIQGTVVHGNQIGRKLQMPTANLIMPKEKLLPPFGVYVTRTRIGQKVYGGITNVGCKPTVEGENPIGAETHLFDFNEDIYGKEIKVEFLSAVRKEKKFESMEALKEQMQKDVQYGKAWIRNDSF